MKVQAVVGMCEIYIKIYRGSRQRGLSLGLVKSFYGYPPNSLQESYQYG